MNLRTVQFVTPTITYRGGMDISTMLCMSPCSSDFIINLLRHRRLSGVKSLRIPHCSARPFLLIARTSQIVTATDFVASTGGFTGCPSI